MKKKVFVSFDFEKDKQYKYLLNAWSANRDIEFTFDDRTPEEIQSNNISVIKANLSRKINEASTTLVLVGEDINKIHKDRWSIGFKNWQHYEIMKSKESGNKIVCAKLKSTNPLSDCIYSWDSTNITYSEEEIGRSI